MRPYLPQGKKSTTFANRSGSSTPRLTASMKVCPSNCCSNRRICRQAKLCQRAFHCQVGKTSEATAELETRFRLDGNRSPRLLISRDWTLRGYNGSLARVIISCKTFLRKKRERSPKMTPAKSSNSSIITKRGSFQSTRSDCSSCTIGR